jgi:methyltransferase (TIGR00027 family)
MSAIADVSDTAFWIAWHRAVESERPDGLFRDPYARRLAGERGRKIAEAMPHARVVEWSVALRTRIIDELIADAVEGGVDVVLSLGAGLDARPYRMDLPASLLWVEADYPRIVEHKEGVLADERPRCRLERAGIDLADPGQRARLLARIDAKASRILVLTEGVVPYLSVEEAGRLADDLRAMGHASGWIVDYFSRAMMQFRARKGMGRAMQNAPFRFDPEDPFAFFEAHGWKLSRIRYYSEEAERVGRPLPVSLPARLAIRALGALAPKARRDAARRFAGYMLLAPAAA